MADEENNIVEAATRDFTEVTHQSWGSKMKDSCTGVLIGFLLFFGSGVLLFWNEGRAISRAKDLDEGKENVLSITVADLDTNSTSDLRTDFENKLIHIVGPVTTEQTVMDPVFGVNSGENSTEQVEALKLRRTVEMFQWVERTSTVTKQTSGGGTRKETTYSYDRTWTSSLIDSYRFRERQYPENPTAFTYGSWAMTGEPLLLGDVLELQDAVANLINWYEPVTGLDVNDIPDEELRSKVTPYGSSGFYLGNGTNSAPQVGDERFQFAAVPSDTVSIVGIYRGTGGSSVGPFPTERGGTILFLERGVFTAEELFLQAEAENEALTWGLRFVGFVLMFVSVLLVLQPFATFVDIIPFVGDFLQGGMERCIFPVIAFIVAFPISLFIIALAWLVYRPYISIPLLVVSLGAMGYLCMKARNKKNELESQQQQPAGNQQETPIAYATPYGAPTKPSEPDVVVASPEEPEIVVSTENEPDVVVSSEKKPDGPLPDFYKPDWAK